MRFIVPCAGLGTRMNMKHNESKEMLIDPSTGYRLIDNVLRIANVIRANVHVITRAEKTDLIEYLATKPNVSVQIIEPKGEWANTVLESQDYWDEHNILVLPDTTWSPKFAPIYQIEESLKLGCYSVFAIHSVEDVSKWGRIRDYTLTEKSNSKLPGYAWGLIGFTKDEGLTIFGTCAHKNTRLELMHSSFVFLDCFKDLTRTGKIE